MEPAERDAFTRDVEDRAEQLVGHTIDSLAFSALAAWLLNSSLGPDEADNLRHFSSLAIWDQPAGEPGPLLVLNRSAHWSGEFIDGLLPSWTVECVFVLDRDLSSAFPDGLLNSSPAGTSPSIVETWTTAADVV